MESPSRTRPASRRRKPLYNRSVRTDRGNAGRVLWSNARPPHLPGCHGGNLCLVCCGDLVRVVSRCSYNKWTVLQRRTGSCAALGKGFVFFPRAPEGDQLHRVLHHSEPVPGSSVDMLHRRRCIVAMGVLAMHNHVRGRFSSCLHPR